MAFDLSQLLGGTTEGSASKGLGYTPEQQQGIQQLLQMGLGGMKDPSAGFEPIAERARSNFEKRTMPSLINRVAALGSGRSSSYDRLAQLAGSDFEEALNAQRAQYGLKNQSNMLDLAKLGLTRYADKGGMAGQEDSGWGDIIGKMGGGALGGFSTAGPWGAAVGAILPLLLRSLSKVQGGKNVEALSGPLGDLIYKALNANQEGSTGKTGATGAFDTFRDQQAMRQAAAGY